MPSLGTTELIIILVIVLLIFGAGKLATLGGALGKGVRDFRSAVKDSDDEDTGDSSEPSKAEPKVASAEAAPEPEETAEKPS